MLDARKLRMLDALDRLGSVAAVAEELHLTAPGISMQLSGLERELGVPLTERRSRRLALTPAGRLLAAHGRDVVERLLLAEQEVASLRSGAVGTYRLAAFPSAARTFVADVWRQLSQEARGLELQVSTPEPEEALATLAAGRAEVAVIHSYSNVPRSLQEGVESEHLASEPVWIAIRADDPAASESIDLERLRSYPWVAPDADLTCAEMMERACGVAGFEPRVVARSTDFSAQLELVAIGAGVALVPELTVAYLPPGVLLAAPSTPIRRHLHAAHRVSLRGDAGVHRIIDALRSSARERVAAQPSRRR